MWWKAASAACSPAPGSWVCAVESQRAMVSKSCSSQVETEVGDHPAQLGQDPVAGRVVTETETVVVEAEHRDVTAPGGQPVGMLEGDRRPGIGVAPAAPDPEPHPATASLLRQRPQPGREPVVRLPVADRALPALVDDEHLRARRRRWRPSWPGSASSRCSPGLPRSWPPDRGNRVVPGSPDRSGRVIISSMISRRSAAAPVVQIAGSDAQPAGGAGYRSAPPGRGRRCRRGAGSGSPPDRSSTSTVMIR